jgi:hypothetical protein
MLTIFTVPKAFRGHVGLIQHNALESWTRLRPACPILLFGDDEGVADAAAKHGVEHVAGVPRNRFGTPLLDWVFAEAARRTTQRLLCYVNADIMLLSDFLAAAAGVPFPEFLMVGQRRNIHLTEPWEFDVPDWEARLREHALRCGELEPPAGSDYFVFPRGCGLERLPPFAVGRPGWDNWMIYRARQLNLPVIDTTPVTAVVHQNHDYAHVPAVRGPKWFGPEGDANYALLGSMRNAYTLEHVTHVLTPDGLRPLKAAGDCGPPDHPARTSATGVPARHT